MKLGTDIIKLMVKNGDVVLDPFIEAHLGPNSYDLRLSKYLFVYDAPEGLDMRREPVGRHFEIPEEGFVLRPGTLYLGSTMERAGSTRYVPHLDGRSSGGRLGLSVHVTAGRGDIGFTGHWTLELTVVEPLRVYAGVRVAQIEFDELVGAYGLHSPKLYTGRYAEDDARPVPSRLWRDFLPVEPVPPSPLRLLLQEGYKGAGYPPYVKAVGDGFHVGLDICDRRELSGAYDLFAWTADKAVKRGLVDPTKKEALRWVGVLPSLDGYEKL